MAKGESTLSPVALSDDIRATIGAVRAMGAEAVLKRISCMLTAAGCFLRPRRRLTAANPARHCGF
jgi:5-enolpyruvylshikimate-3-phosphate synthase